MRRGNRASVVILLAALAVAFAACSSLPAVRGREPVRIGELVAQGDPVRRASHRLLVEGLEADVDGAHARAKGRYERAIQVDPTNPYAYLTLARFEIDRRRAGQARSFLDQTLALFEAAGGTPPRVEAHVLGLSGAIEAINGNRAAAALEFERARRIAPSIWGDAYLTAAELL